jgi:hypothetical protein
MATMWALEGIEGDFTGAHPIEGTGVFQGRPWYFRARHEVWQLCIASRPEGDPLDVYSGKEPGFYWEEPYVEGETSDLEYENASSLVEIGILASGDPLAELVSSLHKREQLPPWLRSDSDLVHAWNRCQVWRALAALGRDPDQSLAVRTCLQAFGLAMDEVFSGTFFLADCRVDTGDYLKKAEELGGRLPVRRALAAELRRNVRPPTLEEVQTWLRDYRAEWARVSRDRAG